MIKTDAWDTFYVAFVHITMLHQSEGVKTNVINSQRYIVTLDANTECEVS